MEVNCCESLNDKMALGKECTSLPNMLFLTLFKTPLTTILTNLILVAEMSIFEWERKLWSEKRRGDGDGSKEKLIFLWKGCCFFMGCYVTRRGSSAVWSLPASLPKRNQLKLNGPVLTHSPKNLSAKFPYIKWSLAYSWVWLCNCYWKFDQHVSELLESVLDFQDRMEIFHLTAIRSCRQAEWGQNW